jgi:putative transposase
MDGSRRYDTDLSDAAWALVAPLLPPARPGGRPRTTDLRAVVDAILYLLRTGCQWRLLPRDFPPWSTVHHYFRTWRRTGVWVRLHRALYPGRGPPPAARPAPRW